MSILYSKSISCYAADTAGICSALFELGGMTIVHDASGCNSTYATHDEPRWYHADSMVYISALTEMDAICGNDQKMVDDVVRAACELHPRFIALCNSPMPMMIGCDMDFIAGAIEKATNIPAFAVASNGMKHYWQGAAGAFMKIAERFLPESAGEKIPRSVNILGATPLDFSLNGNIESIVGFLHKHDYKVLSSWAMNSSWEELMSSPQAAVNLVIANSGLPLAEYMFERYNIPFVCGVPVSLKSAEFLERALDEALKNNRNCFAFAHRSCSREPAAVIVGESVFSGALAYVLEQELGISCCVIDPLAGDRRLLDEKFDRQLDSEAEIADAVEAFELIVADPMYEPIIPAGKKLIRLPHEAFSGRCYHRERLNLMDKKVNWENYICRK